LGIVIDTELEILLQIELYFPILYAQMDFHWAK